MNRDVTPPPGEAQSERLTTADQPVWKIDAVPCLPGDSIRLAFESDDGRWRHGVRLMVDGALSVGETTADQLVLGADTAPKDVLVTVEEASDGLLRLDNVWDSGRGRGMESQAATSGMIREDTATGWRYRCSDVASEPKSNALVAASTAFDTPLCRIARTGEIGAVTVRRTRSSSPSRPRG